MSSHLPLTSIFVDFPSAISADVDVFIFQKLLNKVLALSNLEEVEILQSNLILDFSRQTSMKRVAIDSSMLAALPELSQLEELAVTNMNDEAVEQVERFSHVSRLTLSGAYGSIAKVDSSKFKNLDAITIDITSVEMHDGVSATQATKDSDSSFKTFTSSAGKRSTRSTSFMQSSSELIMLSVSTNASWTNETLNNAICSVQNVGQLQMYGLSNSDKKFTLPTCIANWTTLYWVQCLYCTMPNMTALPNTLSMLWIQFMQGGSYTKAQTGVVAADSPYANYFDWSWFPNMTKLETLYFISCGINGTMPNEYNSSKLTSLDLSGQSGPRNQFTGTVAADWFLKYPKMNGVNWGYNQLTGTIPYYGLQAVESLQISNNKFTHWPPFITNSTTGFGPLSKMSYLDIGSNALEQMPSEEDFLAMKKLGWFYAGGNPKLSGPFPNVFKSNPDSRLNIISASGCNFTGPLPAIPDELLTLYRGGTNSIILSENAFSGTIPSSWATMDWTWMYLSGNPGLNGTLAQISPINGSIVSPFVKSARILRMDGAGFTGPMFNVTTFPIVTNIYVQTPNVDFCAVPRAFLADHPELDPKTDNMTQLFPFTPGICYFTNSNASRCAWAYPSKCFVDAIPIAPSPATPTTPTTSTSPNAPSANAPSDEPTSTASSLSLPLPFNFALLLLVALICNAWIPL